MDIEVIGNRLEAGLWLLIAAVITCHVVSLMLHGIPVPAYAGIAALAFAVFGATDIIESFTGAWWTPWWLFVLKASCVLAFAYCFRAFRRAKAALIKPAAEPSNPTREPVLTLP